MVKRKCGTCRYFRDAGIACSGWCTHPERGELHDLVLVRREELACRNSWDQDLWQPRAETPVGATRNQPQPAAARVPDPAPHASQSVVPENPTDRVTSITISQIRRAREQFVPPAVTGGQPSDAVSVQPEPVAAPESFAEAPSTGVSALEPSFKRALRSGGGRATPRTSGISQVNHRVTGDTSRNSPPAREPIAERSFDVPVRPTLSRPELASDTSPLPVDEVNRLFTASREAAPPASVRPVTDGPPARTPALDQSMRGYQPAPGLERAEDTARIHVDVVGIPGVDGPETFSEPAIEAKPLGPWPIDEKSWARGIPRCCDTCREFQRNPDGRTGVCGSKYAFTRHAVVECDQLACRSSIGVWWLPSDDFWLDRAEIAHHTRPTPYLDAILAEVQSGSR